MQRLATCHTNLQELDVPFYFTTNRLHGMFHASSGAVSNTISALLNAGYKVSRSHASQGSLKTDAPRQFLFDMVREYAKTSPIRIDKISENSPARVLNAGQQVYVTMSPFS
jgi:tRNA (guanine26-N2/guanine27-N2)-dimethyltransferase